MNCACSSLPTVVCLLVWLLLDLSFVYQQLAALATFIQTYASISLVQAHRCFCCCYWCCDGVSHRYFIGNNDVCARNRSAMLIMKTHNQACAPAHMLLHIVCCWFTRFLCCCCFCFCFYYLLCLFINFLAFPFQYYVVVSVVVIFVFVVLILFSPVNVYAIKKPFIQKCTHIPKNLFIIWIVVVFRTTLFQSCANSTYKHICVHS